jgi:hypothetical protein
MQGVATLMNDAILIFTLVNFHDMYALYIAVEASLM